MGLRFDMYYTLPEFVALKGNTQGRNQEEPRVERSFFIHQNKSTSLHAIFVYTFSRELDEGLCVGLFF